MVALCEAQDPETLCAYVGSLHRPPALRTREGEPIVACTAVLEVSDPLVAARVLDVLYGHDGDGWVDMFTISEEEDILRATLAIDGNRLHVQTHSEPRIERVLGLLAEMLPDARLISDRRVPLAPGEVPTRRSAPTATLPLAPRSSNRSRSSSSTGGSTSRSLPSPG